MASLSFVADVSKTVTVDGILYTLTVPTIPKGIHLFLNEVEVQKNIPITLTENMQLGIEVDVPEASKITVNYTNANSAKYDGGEFVTGKNFEVTPGTHTIDFIGATSIPPVSINGDGITGFTVNSTEHTSSELPYTFTPLGGVTNNVYIAGSAGENTSVFMTGTDIAKVAVNGTEIFPVNGVYTLNSSTGVYNVAVEGETYQVDVESTSGIVIKKDGEIVSDGTSELHKIFDIKKDTFFTLDGTHTLTINGTDVKSVSVNGVSYPIENLPFSVKNSILTANVVVNGFEPSEVHIVGQYIDTITVDGYDVPIGEEGAVDLELTTVEQNHFINVMGSQPRQYALAFNNHDSTVIEVDGEVVPNGVSKYINKDVYIEATPTPIPVHFESPSDARVQVNGKDYNSNDFTVSINSATEIDVTTETCKLTVDYGDDSFTLTVPQSVVYITAPHRDGWIFDCWSSSNIGIGNPKQVKTTLDLQGKTFGNLVCHYQRLLTCNKPNAWN